MTASRPPGLGWESVEPFPFSEARRSFTGGQRGGLLIDLRYFRRTADQTLVALAKFGPEAEGAPGRAHGGGVLTVLDEAMGAAAWVKGLPVLTVRISACFRKAVPIAAELMVEMEIVRERGKLVEVRGRLLGPEGLLADSEGTFMKLDGARIKEVFGLESPPRTC